MYIYIYIYKMCIHIYIYIYIYKCIYTHTYYTPTRMRCCMRVDAVERERWSAAPPYTRSPSQDFRQGLGCSGTHLLQR